MVPVASASAAKAWRDERSIERVSIVVFEVMAEKLDKVWWAELRGPLEVLPIERGSTSDVAC